VVDPTPLASFSSNVTSGCAPLKVIFTNTSVIGQPDTIDRLNWEVDEGDGLGFKVVSTQRPNDLTYSQFTNQFNNTSISNKVFNVRLRVITIHNCEKISSTQAITVFPGTISGFSELNYSPFNSNCSPLSVNFKVDSQTQSLSPADYLWKVIDGGGVIQESSTGTNPNFNFKFSNFTNSFKDYKVTLTSTLSSGCKGDSTRTIRISPVPTSLLIIDTLKANCDTVRLRATAAQKGLSVYHWVITENGLPIVNTSSGSDQIERDFTRPKSTGLLIQFSLDAKNFANCVSAITSASIAIPTQDNLDASFSVTPLSQTLPNATISISKPVSTASWNYLWDFGDGSTSSNLDIKNHTYGTYGSFIISLTASNRYCAAKTSQTITVLPSPPIIDFSIGPPSGCMPWRVVFKNLSQYADIKTYQWEFGDGDQSTEVNPTHVYQKPGTYSVSLAASNVTGKVVRLIKTNVIEVYPKPVASFDVKPKLIYLPGGVLYTSNLSFEATTFFWDFGDGITSTEFKPEHIYREEGTYTIQLEASNQYGCTDKSILANEVRVQRGGQILLPNAFSPSSSGVSGGTPGDGKNDTFLPVMRGVVDFEMLVFNRWGELLFETKDASRGWDGTFNGRVCQQDVYMYKLSARFENGELIVRVGDINLIR
jgi:gliding motility-associated-like protein